MIKQFHHVFIYLWCIGFNPFLDFYLFILKNMLNWSQTLTFIYPYNPFYLHFFFYLPSSSAQLNSTQLNSTQLITPKSQSGILRLHPVKRNLLWNPLPKFDSTTWVFSYSSNLSIAFHGMVVVWASPSPWISFRISSNPSNAPPIQVNSPLIQAFPFLGLD